MSEIYMVRHGQVAFDGDGYDGLSTLGEKQAVQVGSALAERGVHAGRLVVGSMSRHHQTAEHVGRATGWSAPMEVDAGWDEFDHVAVLAAAGSVDADDQSLSGPDTLSRFFGVAIPRWSAGLNDEDYPETYGDFTARVTGTFHQLVADLPPKETAVVITSAGVIGRVMASLLQAGERQWLSLIPVGVNCGITRVRATGEKAALISYNEHAHLRQELLTFR